MSFVDLIVCVPRLGQACNHIAALLFYIHHHASEQELPVEVSKTSIPMMWHQPTVSPAPASGMKFAKPCYGDDVRLPSQSVVQRNSFDPHRPYHWQLDPMSVDKLLTQIEWTVPNTGLLQFW